MYFDSLQYIPYVTLKNHRDLMYSLQSGGRCTDHVSQNKIRFTSNFITNYHIVEHFCIRYEQQENHLLQYQPASVLLLASLKPLL